MFLTAQGGIILGPISWLFGKILDWTYNLLANGNGIANVGLCIIIFTLIVKILTFPLTLKQQKSAKINMMIQPEMQKIQKKYKDKKDQESMMKQQKEMQELYDKYGTSMTSGCLPLLIQFPIIMGLYRVIQNIPAYVEQVKAMYSPIAQTILVEKGNNITQFLENYVKDNKINAASLAINNMKKVVEVGVNNVIDVISNFGVSNLNEIIDKIDVNALNIDGVSQNVVANNIDKIDQIHSFVLGINISEAPGYKLTWALLIPFGAAFFQFLQMKLTTTPQQTDAPGGSMMKSMNVTMPLVSLFFTITMPAAIGIYWILGSVFSLVTQLAINAYYDHADMDVILEKQMAKAAKKLEKRGGKKSFMERMMDQSQAAQEELEKREAMKKNSAASLRNYVPSEDVKKAVENKQTKQYKSGSIASKANIMMNYNYDKKEDK